ncbi:MAG: SPOR domain-containing protein, partial [Proteobacteria bacterium]|nr:SPOR domain-containing protein [Pseudomonadota bacterium]
MALFKFPWPGARKDAERDQPSRRSRAAAQAESIEDMRRRARHRLIGAAVLVLVGVIGFPLVFDTQPRPVAVDVAIDIPDRNKVAPLALPQKTPAAAESRPVAEPASAGLDAGEEVLKPRSPNETAAAAQ